MQQIGTVDKRNQFQPGQKKSDQSEILKVNGGRKPDPSQNEKEKRRLELPVKASSRRQQASTLSH